MKGESIELFDDLLIEVKILVRSILLCNVYIVIIRKRKVVGEQHDDVGVVVVVTVVNKNLDMAAPRTDAAAWITVKVYKHTNTKTVPAHSIEHGI